MDINMGMYSQQTQKLVITPEMRQALEILQFNSMELNQFVQRELMNNPVIEIDSKDSEVDGELTNKEIDWQEYISQYEPRSDYMGIDTNKQENEKDFTKFKSITASLKEHLLLQLEILDLAQHEKQVGEYIIENIDQNGYLNLKDKEVIDKFNISKSELDNIIEKIQRFEPTGVAARDLTECLLIQLREKGYNDQVTIDIVTNFLSEIADNKLKVIANELDVSVKEVQNRLDIIKMLEPKPGRVFSMSRDVRYINPDITILKRNGEYIVIVNDIAAPRLNISKYYKRLITDININDKTKEYINSKLNSAVRLIKNIEQRKNTIYKITNEIVNKQIDFFEKGKIYLKAMTLKDIAEEIEVNESTVSRAVNNKYAETPRGIFPLKYFFQSGVESETGEEISAESVKVMIEEIIDSEDRLKPFSDNWISNILNEKGINISRRTVAKYRDKLGIPSSTKRKRY